MIVVSNEREYEFEQERENESSGNARENRTSWREEPRQLTVSPTMKHFRNKDVTPSHIVDFIQILILCRLGVDSNVKNLNKLTLAARRDKKKYILFHSKGIVLQWNGQFLVIGALKQCSWIRKVKLWSIFIFGLDTE